MLMLLGVILSILIPLWIYRRILQGQESVDHKLYIKTFLLGATLYTVPIIVLEVLWDVFFKHEGAMTLGSALAQAFLRAALLEEGVKFFFCHRLLKRQENLNMKQSILLAGLVGIGYGVTEKIFYGTGFATITNALLPGHMLFQWIMGYYLSKALRAEGAQKKKLLALAYGVPFLIHGLWDAGIDITDLLLEGNFYTVLSFILLAAMVAAMLTAIILSAKRIRRMEE